MAADRRVAVRPARSERPAGDALVLRALASFHAAVLTALLVLAAHLGGSLGLALQSVGTGTGIVLYAALWAISAWTARRAFEGVALDPAGSLPRLGLAQPAIVWGSVSGAAFLLVLLAVRTAARLMSVGLRSDEALDALATFGVVALAGGLVAAVVGGVIGLTLGAVDRVLIGAGLAIARWADDGADAIE